MQQFNEETSRGLIGVTPPVHHGSVTVYYGPGKFAENKINLNKQVNDDEIARRIDVGPTQEKKQYNYIHWKCPRDKL